TTNREKITRQRASQEPPCLPPPLPRDPCLLVNLIVTVISRAGRRTRDSSPIITRTPSDGMKEERNTEIQSLRLGARRSGKNQSGPCVAPPSPHRPHRLLLKP
ncbi:unnamed protein product, partial [Ectocarpus sp. 12 AP-2014]